MQYFKKLLKQLKHISSGTNTLASAGLIENMNVPYTPPNVNTVAMSMRNIQDRPLSVFVAAAFTVLFFAPLLLKFVSIFMYFFNLMFYFLKFLYLNVYVYVIL